MIIIVYFSFAFQLTMTRLRGFFYACSVVKCRKKGEARVHYHFHRHQHPTNPHF